jgi:hypothetical protein
MIGCFLFLCGILRIGTKYSSPCPLLVEEGKKGWWSKSAKLYLRVIFS